MILSIRRIRRIKLILCKKLMEVSAKFYDLEMFCLLLLSLSSTGQTMA